MSDIAHDQHAEHGGLGKYVAVFVMLCILTSASFFTYSSYWPFKDTPQVGWAFMMAVSCTKALLVILFFMHLLWEANWKYVLTIPASFMSLFLILMLVPDIGWRMNNGFASYSEERLQHAAVPQTVRGDARAEHAQPHGSRGAHQDAPAHGDTHAEHASP